MTENNLGVILALDVRVPRLDRNKLLGRAIHWGTMPGNREVHETSIAELRIWFCSAKSMVAWNRDKHYPQRFEDRIHFHVVGYVADSHQRRQVICNSFTIQGRPGEFC